MFLFPSYEDCETALSQWLIDEFDDDELVILQIHIPDNFLLEDSAAFEKKLQEI